MSPKFLKTFLVLIFLAPLFIFNQTVFAGDDWKPIPPEEIALKTPKVETDADAEAIFWEVRVDDSSDSELALKHYVRVKIFTERGRNNFSKHDIPFLKGTRIKDVEARVTKPDGSTVFLKKEDVLEREIIKTSGIKVRAKSFALPGLEIGSIVEYRYREIISDGSANMRLVFQREIPIQNISYFVKPYSGDRAMAYFRFNTGETKFEKDKNGFHRATMLNVPAFREEPNMLPEDQVKSWMYIYYTAESNVKPEEYWKNISKAFFENSKGALKVNDEIKSTTAEVISGATTDEEKLRKIYQYCKTQIKNLSYSSNVTEEDWKKVNNAKNSIDTLRLKMGSPGDIDVLFGAMARAAGFEARLALSGDRSEMFFDPTVPNYRLMLNSSSIAIKMGDKWQFYSPASYYAPFGMLNWSEEAQTTLITDGKEPIWAKTPLTSAENSKEKRTGKFKLLEDGTLEGEARLEFTGHRAIYHKRYNDSDSQAVRESTLKDFIRQNILGSADVQDFTIENVTDPEKPFVYTFKIRVPGYASRTGKRLFFQPNVFERSAKPRFGSNTRKYDVYMSYPWSEEDEIVIELPSGFALESPDAPSALEDTRQGIFSHKVVMSITNDQKTLIYKRKFFFGNNGFIQFPVTSYGQVKNLFEAINKADVHQLTLRQGDVPPPPAKTN
jgi:hypothetical protein